LEPIVGKKLPTAIPDRVLDTDMTIDLGGGTVLLHRLAPSHSVSMIMVLFPKYRALQCTDACESKSMVAAQDVDFIDVGHYTPATRPDQTALRAYMVDLHQQVFDLVRSSQSWDQLYRHVRFSDEVKKWTAFDTLHTRNVMGMSCWVSNHRRGQW